MIKHRFDGKHRAGACSCGAHHPTTEAAMEAQVDAALLAGLFPDAVQRRGLLRTVGAATLLAALADILPVGTLRAIAQERAAPEKPKLAIGFLPITCAVPLIMGYERGTFAKQGLEVTLQKVPGIALIRDKMINGELDLSQQVMPVPLATTAGVGGTVVPTKVLTILNQNGNSLVLANKHVNNRDPKNWKGFRFAVPFELSHQTLQLRYYLARAGLDPDRDVSYRVVPPSEYVSNLRTDNIDGFFGGEPGGQRAVYERAGFIHLISKEIWPGHPCCSITATDAWIDAHPNTFMAFFRAAIEAGVYASEPANRTGMAKIVAQPGYLNQPETVIEQVIGGRFADGLGHVQNVPDRVDYQPFPHPSMAIWLVGQMKRWKMLPSDVDAKKLATQVMLATEARKLMAEAGAPSPGPDNRVEVIMGEPFDANAAG
jgi:nitrate/nitrite transport system substrate-binding protein